MTVVLALLSSVIWWVIISSVGAVVPSLIAWVVLRWNEGTTVVFNRTYLACLIWGLFVMLVCGVVAAHLGIQHGPFSPLIHNNGFRVAQALSMVVGVLALWRLVPRIDARRIRLGSACMAMAAVMAVSFGIATTLASL
ncbi:hypothetical protein EO087_06400 [Dyella sp. M7H15-1]|uniref:hypothetical protein n=1 Tax=Dyella sp. M7H15-1 TaxID=2501295 RepID=UPI0010051A10|nr:hypothetical protein [Dyella sp. M7H15-1]QAU23660.1 hypothetical protein EO087_06400 [Dyella sp. M7H15-1]